MTFSAHQYSVSLCHRLLQSVDTLHKYANLSGLLLKSRELNANRSAQFWIQEHSYHVKIAYFPRLRGSDSQEERK